MSQDDNCRVEALGSGCLLNLNAKMGPFIFCL